MPSAGEDGLALVGPSEQGGTTRVSLRSKRLDLSPLPRLEGVDVDFSDAGDACATNDGDLESTICVLTGYLHAAFLNWWSN